MLSIRNNPILSAQPSNDATVIMRTRAGRETFATKVALAAKAIDRLPDGNESIHLIAAGQFSLADTIPVIHHLAGQAIDALHVASLSFSNDNTAMLCQMLDSGQIRQLIFLLSHYFEKTSAAIAGPAVIELGKRGAKIVVARNHAKIIAAKIGNETVTVISSANLRSKHNFETMLLCGSPEVYRFYTGWVDSLENVK